MNVDDIDELTSVSWELKKGEFYKLYALYEMKLEQKGLTKEKYDFDEFMSDVFSLFLHQLHTSELKLTIDELM